MTPRDLQLYAVSGKPIFRSVVGDGYLFRISLSISTLGMGHRHSQQRTYVNRFDSYISSVVGADPSRDLHFLYEGHENFAALPAFAVIPAQVSCNSLFVAMLKVGY